MFRALLCPSSEARDYDVDYHIGRYRSWFAVSRTLLQPTAPNLQLTANQERNDQCGNQHHSRELLMIGHSSARNMLSI